MRVVLDTNVFVSSFLGTGAPREIIDRWKEGQITLCFSRPIMDEYVLVLERLGLSREQEIQEILHLFARGFHCLFTSNAPPLELDIKDPDDRKFFECAVRLDAQFLISGDKHVIQVREYLGIRVMTPRQFVQTAKTPE